MKLDEERKMETVSRLPSKDELKLENTCLNTTDSAQFKIYIYIFKYIEYLSNSIKTI